MFKKVLIICLWTTSFISTGSSSEPEASQAMPKTKTDVDFIVFDGSVDVEAQKIIITLLEEIQRNPVGEKLLQFIAEDLPKYKSIKELQRKGVDKSFEYPEGDPINKILIRIGDDVTTSRIKRDFSENNSLPLFQRRDQIVITLTKAFLTTPLHLTTTLGGLADNGLYECGASFVPSYLILAHELIHVLHILDNEEDYYQKNCDTGVMELWPIYSFLSIKSWVKLWKNEEEQRTVIGISSAQPFQPPVAAYTREYISDFALRLAAGLSPRYAYQEIHEYIYERPEIITAIFGSYAGQVEGWQFNPATAKILE